MFTDKYTDIYDALGLLGFKGIVVFGGSTSFPSPYPSELPISGCLSSSSVSV